MVPLVVLMVVLRSSPRTNLTVFLGGAGVDVLVLLGGGGAVEGGSTCFFPSLLDLPAPCILDGTTSDVSCTAVLLGLLVMFLVGSLVCLLDGLVASSTLALSLGTAAGGVVVAGVALLLLPQGEALAWASSSLRSSFSMPACWSKLSRLRDLLACTLSLWVP